MIQSRTHNCNELRIGNVGERVTLVGWFENMRKVSKNLGFVILRDFYGTTQLVVETEEMMNVMDGINKESTISVEGVVRERSSKNTNLPTGEIEVVPDKIEILGKCIYNALPFEINQSKDADENARLKYRYLDLRNPNMKKNIVMRSQIVAELRQRMYALNFMEITTPILTCSSPEGARDYLVPARNHPGKFYALPQAPQQFKQILMASGFDRYFQIAPCFRDEDARADRSPGEFYQLDFEMSFATQEDVFRVGEEVLTATFEKFAPEGSVVTAAPYPVISYKQAMLEFGSDKPDLRNPLRIVDVTDFFQRCTFKPFHGQTVRAIKVSNKMSKGFHEKLLKFATSIGMGGLGYLEVMEDKSYKGPIDKFIPDDMKEEITQIYYDDFLDELEMNQIPLELYCKRSGHTEDEIYADKEQEAIKTIQAQSVLHAVAAAEKISITPEELAEELRAIAIEEDEDPEEFVETLEEEDVENIADQLTMDKTMAFILDSVIYDR